MNNHLSSLLSLFNKRTEFLEKYSANISSIIDDVENDRIDRLDTYSAKNEDVIEALKSLDAEAERIIQSLSPEQSNTIQLLVQQKLNKSECPQWAKELYDAIDRFHKQLDTSVKLNRDCAEIMKTVMEQTKEDIVKSNQSNNVYNYYLSLNQSNSGIVLDIKE